MVLGIPDAVSNTYVPDKRVAVFDIEIEKLKGKTYLLKGKTSLPEAHAFLLERLNDLSVEVIDSVQMLPSKEMGDQTWGLVSISVAPMRGEPRYSAEMVSQAILGTPVKLLDQTGGWYLVQTPDEYLGWISKGSIEPMDSVALENWKTSDRYVFHQNNGWLHVRADEDSNPVSDLVMGSLIQVDGKDGKYLHATLPDGRQGYVKASDCMPINEWAKADVSVLDILAEAKSLLGSPYLWGGTSTKGIDCSGFTKTCYYSQGIVLARDASQQARYGEAVDISNYHFQPGDLLFFGNSIDRVTHVGLYLGNGQFIHSSGQVKINSFNPEDSNYEARRKESLVAARRVLNSINTGQIIPVKDHPWYN